jgi:uncharacterized protein
LLQPLFGAATAGHPSGQAREKSMAEPFYQNGLKFECTMCHACCRFEPGYVFLSESDVQRLMKGTGLSREEFLETYCRTVPIGGARMLSLKEKENYDCIFWDNGCTVYRHRPLQCRSYPFWGANLVSKRSWQAVARACPGVNRGKLFTKEEIDQWLKSRREDPPIVL